MKLVHDITGRFRERPHYELDELEEECEQTAFTFLEEQYGQVLIPIPTNALVVLIEQYAEDLDLFADLRDQPVRPRFCPVDCARVSTTEICEIQDTFTDPKSARTRQVFRAMPCRINR